ncbi:MAG: glyoxalase [Rhodobacteraceae bacterium]|nr:MAG: glyoxalase [Paracoccaceae bacterium]
MAFFDGYHHLTLSVDGAQEDNDFYTKTLGMKTVKKTVLFDGTMPVYHLYYGNETGDPSTIITTFPYRKLGIYGKRGTNQSKIIQLSIPKGSADFWVNRLGDEGFKAAKIDRFARTRVAVEHPCGIPHELVETTAANDDRRPIVSAGVGADQGIKGIYGVAISVFDKTSMDDFLTVGFGMTGQGEDGNALKFNLPTSGPGSVVEILHEPNLPQGTWTLSGGTIHHMAFNTRTEENQMALKAHLEGLGFTDVSDQKDRNYFKSCYVRSPGGALFELAFSYGKGWAKDESPDALGQILQFPEWFEDRREEMEAGLESFKW